MAISREELHHIINQIPDDKLPAIGLMCLYGSKQKYKEYTT
jgi:hypothetical protein